MKWFIVVNFKFRL